MVQTLGCNELDLLAEIARSVGWRHRPKTEDAGLLAAKKMGRRHWNLLALLGPKTEFCWAKEMRELQVTMVS